MYFTTNELVNIANVINRGNSNADSLSKESPFVGALPVVNDLVSLPRIALIPSQGTGLLIPENVNR